jgi:pseudouridine-5'-phosphate glycosidase
MPAIPDDLVFVAPTVREALRYGQAVVALETALVTHGLPAPWNVETALAAEAAIRERDAVPATVAVHGGRLVIGLTADEIEQLAHVGDPLKVSRNNLAAALGGSGWGGTTVTATMVGATLAGIRVFATGGIGGVHRDAASTFDVSADLQELARAPIAVVCSGPKSILDTAATLEHLESLGVPVVGLGTDEVPGFLSRESGLAAPVSVDTAGHAAQLAQRHWALGLTSAVLFVVPPPEETALSRADLDAATERALREAASAHVRGPDATPWVLRRIAQLTQGRSVQANVALIRHNAALAADVAVALGDAGG